MLRGPVLEDRAYRGRGESECIGCRYDSLKLEHVLSLQSDTSYSPFKKVPVSGLGVCGSLDVSPGLVLKF